MRAMRSLILLSAWATPAMADELSQPVVYEISTRPWLYSLAQAGVAAQCGDYVCLKDVPLSEWQRMADDHIEVVWLMGIWQLGQYGLDHDRSSAKMAEFRTYLPDVQEADVIGSPYAIAQYCVHSDIGSNADLSKVRSILNTLGIKLMLDFVPNHQAVDNSDLEAKSNIFLAKPASTSSPDNWWIQRDGRMFAYGRGPYDGPWTDTIQVNYWSQAGIQAMKEHLLFVASQADAIRCDMAHLMLNEVWQNAWGNDMQAGGFSRPGDEFWSIAISNVRSQYPNTLFMAEAYDYHMTSPPEKEMLQNLGFDFVYDKTVLDKLEDNHLDDMRAYIGGQPQSFFERTAHFVENHDEPRAVSALHGQQQAFTGAVAASTIPGLRLYFFGQFDGFSKKLGVQVRRAVAEQPSFALHAQYTKLLSVLASPVFHHGTWSYISIPKDGTGWRLMAWRWSYGDSKRLVVINFSEAQAWGNVQVADAAGPSGSDDIKIIELLSDTAYTRSASDMRSSGLVCGVDPYSAQIFQYDGDSAMI